MSKKLRRTLGTSPFKWGVIGVVTSAIFLILSVIFHDSAERRLEEISGDPRYEVSVWEQLPAEQQQRLGRDLMSARNNLSQIAMGKVIFSITLTISLILLIVSFVRVKNETEQSDDEEHDDDA
ncbi:MAG TPA: hypothetical protein PKH10_12245 [bacterium]|nr:hypothetical protein [bacterium]